MGYGAKWKVLEELMLELQKRGFETPPFIINDLRSAKLMIKIIEVGESKGDTAMKLDEILGGIESDLVIEAQNRLGDREVDKWLKRLDESILSTCEVKGESQSRLVTGVPRDQKWIRIEPIPNLPAEKLTLIAKENSLSVSQQKDGRLVIYGRQEGIMVFLKKMTEEAQPKSKVTS